MTPFRAPAFQQWMARLALAAVLLLALAPALSRAAALAASPQALGAMCTADGLAPATVAELEATLGLRGVADALRLLARQGRLRPAYGGLWLPV